MKSVITFFYIYNNDVIMFFALRIEYRREDVAANEENKVERLIAINVCRSEQR